MGSADPREIGKLLEYEFDQRNERLNSGITLTYTPQAQLTNRFTFGYDYSNQEGENQRNFGFFLKPLGSRTNDTFQRRVLTFGYVGTYNLPITSTINSNFSWGCQAIGDSQVRLRLFGEDFPGAAEPTVSSRGHQGGPRRTARRSGTRASSSRTSSISATSTSSPAASGSTATAPSVRGSGSRSTPR